MNGWEPLLHAFKAVWIVDYEFGGASGERPIPRCVVAHEVRSATTLRIFEDELLKLGQCPYAIDDSSVVVTYYGSAEVGCHLALGWPPPANMLDLFVEFRNATNGLELPHGNGLLGALAFCGLDGIEVAAKEEGRMLAVRGGPWSPGEPVKLLDYCESDIQALLKLGPRLLSVIDLPQALYRGRYMVAAARMEHAGVPVDAEHIAEVRRAWPHLKHLLIADLDASFGVFDGETFRHDRFAAFLQREDIRWPTTETGRLALDDETFRMMTKIHPTLAPLHELRQSLSQLRLESLAIGGDGRNRTLLSAFRSRTGRNQPSNSKFIFGPATWIRSFMRPEPGYGLAYVDYDQQEWAIGAALSGDAAMQAAYLHGDAYIAFAAQAGGTPWTATKHTHHEERERFKQCGLGVMYRMGAETLATRISGSAADAAELLRLHHRLYPRYWAWSNAAIDYALLRRQLHTVFGWKVRPTVPAGDVRAGMARLARSLGNFPVQANGAEMMRLACIYLTEAGVEVCAPVHDAVLIHAPLEVLDDTVAFVQRTMADASADVLGGFRLRTEAKVIRYPDRYADRRGEVMWERVTRLVREAANAADPPSPSSRKVR